MVAPHKIASSTALGGAAAITTFYGLLFGESLFARRVIGVTDARPPSADGIYGADLPGDQISCLILGDSAAVGYGMEVADDTPPGLVGRGLTHLLGCPVQITSVAVVGAKSSDLDAQIDIGLKAAPQIALIIIGTNDVTHQVLPSYATKKLFEAVRRLCEAGCDVVVGTCPDLGSIKPLPQPLRASAQSLSRRLAAKQALATLNAGGRAVSLGSLLGPVFAARADVMFGVDNFHPSKTGYAHMVSVVLPSMAGAIGERESSIRVPETGRDMLPIKEATTKAAQHAGTELTRAGRWAALSLRRRSRSND